jgi:NADH:ubiquinone oxidoreductase subunit 5 (subunit L)/multisubunit Na+/H+ antiporter MnhA subunit
MLIILSLSTLLQEDMKKIVAYSTSNQSFFI